MPYCVPLAVLVGAVAVGDEFGLEAVGVVVEEGAWRGDVFAGGGGRFVGLACLVR